ncbi:MAG TPA: 3-deoxy-7-phosphoheptulonate synthase [Streptosporangiaceae bacterium]|nr:3-deoxy-7-phosphoheptulonate synthase [Streptosporangiaceae bacterium]
MHDLLAELLRRPAQQQPEWDDTTHVESIRRKLSASPSLVDAADVRALRSLLARVAEGEAQIVQAGDCAEDPAECGRRDIVRKTGLVHMLAGIMQMNSRRPVVRVGRIAGQFGKPRSRPTEMVAGVEMPTYRGHLVNSPEPDPRGRRPDPRRLLACYKAARTAMTHLGWHRASRAPRATGLEPRVWTSHETLVLDYEVPLVRRDDAGRLLLTSTHWPWIGERTRQVDGAHVALLAQVANPVACKVGPAVTADELVTLCERLDPHREKGKLTLIARMGDALVPERLPGLVAAVRASGHPVIWLSDPMHANSVVRPDKSKTRYLETIKREVDAFQCAVRAGGGLAAGLHLEATPDNVTECLANDAELERSEYKYTSFCDPRLNPRQAAEVVSLWAT